MKTNNKTEVLTLKRTLKSILIIALSFLVLSTSWTLFAQTEESSVYDKLKPFFESLYFIENEYYQKDEINYDDLIDSSVRGIIAGLDDPFSYYLTPEDV